MKSVFLVFLFCISLEGAPTVCLNMIVKNEAHVITRCLESVKPLIDTWVIVDTGSTDGTQEIIREFMKDIPGELYERPWVDFAHNRNEALALAKNKADYLFFIDADDVVQIEPDFKKPAFNRDCYKMTVTVNGLVCRRIQFVKSSLDWKWEGVLHEFVGSSEAKTTSTLSGATMVAIGGGDRSRNPQKYYQDALALEKALQGEPNNSRYVFYLAASYQAAEMYDLALQNYRRRTEMGGVEDEIHWSLYQIGVIQERLDLPEATVTKGYLDAYNFCPLKIEPLYRLSNYYRRKDKHLLCYLLSQHALHIQPPKKAMLCEMWTYQYGIKLENSISAYWVGQYQEAYFYSQFLLADHKLPLDIRECVEKNLKFIVPKMPPGTVFHPLKKLKGM